MEPEEAPAGKRHGTGQGLMDFLTWAIEKNELVESTGSALRTGALKVLSVEDDWEQVDLKTLDIDSLVERFNTKYRLSMKDRTRSQYEQRLRQSLDMYMRWLANDPGWKPSRRHRVRASTLPRETSNHSPDDRRAVADVSSASVNEPTSDGSAVSETGMVTYPFPIRPGMLGKLTLPIDLTAHEAQRISSFVETLAVDQDAR